MTIYNAGHRFNRWTCTRDILSLGGRDVFVCECGKKKLTNIANVVAGRSKSCGCLQKEWVDSTSTHRESTKNSRLYRIWSCMLTRCNNPKASAYARYGERGISVCEEWSVSYTSFRDWDIKCGYSEKLSIDRRDNNAGYNPENCRWATNIEQANNCRDTRFVSFKGELIPRAVFVRMIGANYNTVRSQLERGMDPHEIAEKHI